jgi:putative membrane protein insertion efficiency factor
MRLLIRILVRLYQFTLSPLLVAIAGSGCRFHPTCSQYFLESVEINGPGKGTWLGLKRIARCHPWGPAGHDPVPGLWRLSGHGDDRDPATPVNACD